MKYVDSVEDSKVSPINEDIKDNLKNKYSTSQSFHFLMEEIKKIHINHEKKFLLHDPKNTMTLPDPVPKI